MNKDTIIKEDYRLPIEIINKFNENFKTIHNKSSSFLSSIIETEFYTKGVLERIMEKNDIIWSSNLFNGRSISLKEGLVKFNNSTTYLYFIRRKDEDTYKFYCLYEESSSDSVVFFLNGYKKYKTI